MSRNLLKKSLSEKNWISVVDINMSKIAYERLPFKTFNYLFYRHRGSKSPAIDKYCTRFYLEEIDQSPYVDQTFVVKKTDLASTNVLNLMEQVSVRSFNLSLYYAVGDFLSHDPKSDNFSETFMEVANNSFGLYFIYVEVLFRVYFNKLNEIRDIIVYNYFTEKKNQIWVYSEEKKTGGLFSH